METNSEAPGSDEQKVLDDRAGTLTSEELHSRRRYLMFIEYRGTEFSGSQRQPEPVVTVQYAIEKALLDIMKEPVTLHVSSRTDAGVHALANSAHITIIRRQRKSREIHPEPFEPETLRIAINFWLKKNDFQCRITAVHASPLTMDARKSATLRTYVYRIICPATVHTVSMFEYNHCWPYPDELDVSRMQQAAKHLLGTHDFSSFRAAGCTASTPIRTVQEMTVQDQIAAPAWAPPSTNATYSRTSTRSIVITLKSRAFLYHQCRLMVAWLVACGSGTRDPDDGPAVLAALDVNALGVKMAPSWGLYLAEVHYDKSLLLPSPNWVSPNVSATADKPSDHMTDQVDGSSNGACTKRERSSAGDDANKCLNDTKKGRTGEPSE